MQNQIGSVKPLYLNAFSYFEIWFIFKPNHLNHKVRALEVNFELHDGIKRRLRAKGTTFVEIAKELGVSTVAITRVCQGRARSARVQHAIATKLGVHPSTLWPDRYGKEESMNS